jgi:acyl dehydratase
MLPDPSGQATRSDDELAPGFAFRPWTFAVDAAYQARKLGCCDIDPAIWGEFLDPSHFALLTIRHVNRDGFSINGSVHMVQHYHQREPVRIGEEITLHGRITGIEPAPRGTLMHAAFEVVCADGSVPLTLSRTSVRMDHNGEAKGPAGGGGAAAANPDAGFLDLPKIGAKQLTPDGVGNYSDDRMNRIHDDPEIARQFGFRAPIAAGIMGSHIMLEALVRDGGRPVRELEMEVRFRRPMFWDELLTVTGQRAAANGGHLARVSLMKPEGKPACFGLVERVVY